MTLVLGVCESDGGSDDSDATKRSQLAVAFVGDDPNDVPYTWGLLRLHDQHRAPASRAGKPVARRRMASASGTSSRRAGSWLVTFRETWFCSDWSAVAAGYPPCDGISGFHEWEYLVDLDAGTVELLDDTRAVRAGHVSLRP